MARLNSIDLSTLSDATRRQLAAETGDAPVADVYRQLGNSDATLSAYLGMELALLASRTAGRLNDRDIETIKLLLSELTQCHFCLSVHTGKARKAGLDLNTQRKLRRGEPLEQPRLDCLARLVRQLFGQPGVLDPALLAEARDLGFCDAALLDLCLAMSTIFFTNISNHVNDTRSTLPPAPALDHD